MRTSLKLKCSSGSDTKSAVNSNKSAVFGVRFERFEKLVKFQSNNNGNNAEESKEG